MSVQVDIVDQTIEVQIVEDEVVDIAIWNGISIQANGTFVAKTRILNFSEGDDLAISEEGNKVNIVVPTGGGSGSAIQFKDEGVDLGNNQASAVDFVGSSVVATRSGDTITVTIEAPSSVGSKLYLFNAY